MIPAGEGPEDHRVQGVAADKRLPGCGQPGGQHRPGPPPFSSAAPQSRDQTATRTTRTPDGDYSEQSLGLCHPFLRDARCASQKSYARAQEHRFFGIAHRAKTGDKIRYLGTKPGPASPGPGLANGPAQWCNRRSVGLFRVLGGCSVACAASCDRHGRLVAPGGVKPGGWGRI